MKKTGIFAPKTQFFPFKTQVTAGLRPELSCRKVYKKKAWNFKVMAWGLSQFKFKIKCTRRGGRASVSRPRRDGSEAIFWWGKHTKVLLVPSPVRPTHWWWPMRPHSRASYVSVGYKKRTRQGIHALSGTALPRSEAVFLMRQAYHGTPRTPICQTHL